MNIAETVIDKSRSELREVVCRQLQLLLEQNNYEGAKSLLLPVPPVDIAEAIADLPETLQLLAFRLLKKAEAINVYEYLDPEVQQSLIKKFNDQEAISIVNDMSPDDRVKLFDELPSRFVRRLIRELTTDERQVTSLLLGYPKDTAGRIMTPEYLQLPQTLTAQEAQREIRQLAKESEVNYYIYITGELNQLLGIISLRDLILVSPDQQLGDIMATDIVYAYTDTDQEEVARLIQRYDLLALPIVDRGETLLGVVTVDDVIDILEQEATEDIYRMAAVQSEGDDYFKSSLWGVTKKRIPWLLILLVTNSATVLVMSRYEAVLDAVVAFAFFTPLLVDTGGNVGAQSSTVVIRGLSTYELNDKKPAFVVWRELMTGGILGIVLGILVIVLVFLLLGQAEVGVTVGISLLIISTLAAATGAALPFIFTFFGLDPALMSAPFITTIVDITGIFVYLNTAKLLLNI